MSRSPFLSDSKTLEPLIIEHFSLRVYVGGLLMLVVAVIWGALAIILLIEGIFGVFLFILVVFMFLLTGGQGMWILGTAIMTRFSDQPVLVIDHEGIQDQSLPPSGGWLRWDEIDRIESFTFLGETMFAVTPTDLFAYLAWQHPLTRLLMWFRLVLVGAPILLSINQLPISREELFTAIDQHHPIDPSHRR